MTQAAAELSFARFVVQPAARRLLVDGKPAVLGARAFDLLLALIERRERVVAKNELFDLVWPGLVVEENNLQVQISALRKLLGAQAIATIPGRGYRFTLPLDQPNPAAAPESAPGASALAGAPVPHDTPTESPPLYGRAQELAALCELIGHHPLVTVVGPGGIGKTRLVEAVAREMRGEFAEGVWLVELASLADPDLVAATVARAIGIAAGDLQLAIDYMVQALAAQRALLVLDNCEHLLDAVDRLVAALRKGAPRVRIVVTSQELLRHPDEHVYRLGPLALPAELNAASALAAGAVALFVARAQALEPRFCLTEANVGAVVDICRRLDGIALAIELAAARVPLLGVDGVRERLDERFRLLTAGTRIALRRHQTLRAALEWSYGLLSAPEQLVFDRLGVFAGGFSLPMAQQIASDQAIDEWAALDHLAALVDKSLVLVDAGKVPRYRMLETTRAFAVEQLARRGVTQDMLRQHAQAVLQLFEANYLENLQGTPPHEQLRRLIPDLDNLRAAMNWIGESEAERQLAIALIGAAGGGHGFLWNAAIPWEARKWCEALKSKVDDSIPAAHLARFWMACAEQGIAGSVDESARDAQRAVALFRAANDRLGTYLALNALCYALTLGGRHDEAGQAFDEMSRLCDPSWSPRMRGIFENIAALHFADSQPARAREHLEAYLNLSRQSASTMDEQTALVLMVDLDVQLGQADRAVETARRLLAGGGVSIHSQDGFLHRNLATALMESGALDEAEAAFREALPLFRRAYGSSAFVLDDMASLLAHRGRLEDAARLSAFAQRVYADRQRKPRRVALLLCERLRTRLAAGCAAERLQQLFDEGRRLTDDEACALAFPPAQPAAR